MQYDDIEEESLTKPLRDYSKKCTAFCRSDGELENGRYNLKPGIYYIVPFLDNTFKSANFFLQVLSEQRDILE